MIAMTRTSALLLLFLAGAPFVSVSQSLREEGSVRIVQNGSELDARDGLIQIRRKPFEIVVSGVDEEDNIAIFASPRDRILDRYRLPVSTSDTVMFAPGTGIAMPPNEDRRFFLRINREMSQNYFSRDRRINTGERAVLQIKGITDPYEQFAGGDTVYLTLFVDFNKDRMIEEHELANLVLKLVRPVKESGKNRH
jgi:hypothetical protein